MKLKIGNEIYTLYSLHGSDCQVRNSAGNLIAGTMNTKKKTIQLMGWNKPVKYEKIPV